MISVRPSGRPTTSAGSHRYKLGYIENVFDALWWADPPDLKKFTSGGEKPEYSWIHRSDFDRPFVNPLRHVGRNDPALVAAAGKPSAAASRRDGGARGSRNANPLSSAYSAASASSG